MLKWIKNAEKKYATKRKLLLFAKTNAGNSTGGARPLSIFSVRPTISFGRVRGSKNQTLESATVNDLLSVSQP